MIRELTPGTGGAHSLGELLVTVIFKKLDASARLPSYALPGDAGMDVYALHDSVIAPRSTEVISTGIAIAIPYGFFGSCRERSSLAAAGLRLGAGVIDSGYRGEIKGVLTNLGKHAFSIERCDRIFQFIIQPIAHAEIEEAEDLPDSIRGKAGFGSTGRK